MKDFDDILEEIGSFGPFQITVFLLVSSFETPTAWAMFLQVFVAADQPWTCSSLLDYNQSNGDNFSKVDPLNESLYAGDSFSHSQCCELIDKGGCGQLVFTGELTTIISEWNLVCDLEYVKSLIMTFQMLGVLVGAVVIGQLADMYGRRIIYFVVYTLLLVVFFGSSFANSWQLYCACRMIIGALIGGTMVVNFVLPLEMVGRKWRTFCGCIGFWACGVMSLALLAYFIRGWRILSISCSITGIPVLLSYWFIPESPRWLIQKGRVKEAEEIIRHIARQNKRPDPDLSELLAYVKEEEKRHCKIKRYGVWDLFRNLSMTKNTIIMMYAWFVSSAVYYGTSLNVGNLSGDRYINFFLSGLVEIPALLLVVLINNRIGRKKTLALLMSVAGVSCFAILFIKLAGKLEELHWLATLLALLGKSGISGGWAAAQVFAAEVFPTVVRNVGVGVSSMSARVGGILAPQIVALNRLSKPLPFIVFGVLGIVCAVLCVFLPETLNMPLPDALPPCQWSNCLVVKRRQQMQCQAEMVSSMTNITTVEKCSMEPNLLNSHIICSEEPSQNVCSSKDSVNSQNADGATGSQVVGGNGCGDVSTVYVKQGDQRTAESSAEEIHAYISRYDF